MICKFVDMTNILDTTNCKSLENYDQVSCPDQFISMFRQSHKGMPAQVLDDSDNHNIY